MKYSLRLIILGLIFSFAPFMVFTKSEFCQGFERGYITGYKQVSGQGYDPYTPYCPYQPYKKYNDPESDFEHGYIIGMKQGQNEGS